ncbi:MAG: hypothetical protein KGR98_03475 [Verrucomicrobia bacterium]|nr:hypothetical protein [Verrucomicrobiota bacterium]
MCLHEGKKGRSIDPIFIRTLLKTIRPPWIRPWDGNNIIRPQDCGGRAELIARMPAELKGCLEMGGDTTLMVWADLDDDMENCEMLKAKFQEAARANGITDEQFNQVVFVFAKDRLENWIEFLNTGATDESREGPRLKDGRPVADAARRLAQRCLGQQVGPAIPPSLDWSCQNWRSLVARMRR